MIGGNMGNPNPAKQAYRCKKCGAPRPPYQFYCERHLDAGEKRDAARGRKPLVIDRIMKRMLGH